MSTFLRNNRVLMNSHEEGKLLLRAVSHNQDTIPYDTDTDLFVNSEVTVSPNPSPYVWSSTAPSYFQNSSNETRRYMIRFSVWWSYEWYGNRKIGINSNYEGVIAVDYSNYGSCHRQLSHVCDLKSNEEITFFVWHEDDTNTMSIGYNGIDIDKNTIIQIIEMPM